MRALLMIAMLAGCDAGEKPTPPPPPSKPAPTPILDDAAIPAEPAEPHVIDWQVGGLGTWKNNVGGILWHVAIDLDKKTLAVTDPGGITKQRVLAADAVQNYARLAKAVRAEPHSTPRHSCTDRSETLRIDILELSDSCPLADPAAGALTTVLGRELK